MHHTKYIQVLKGLSFSYVLGTLGGLLGINGDGKATTLRTLTRAISVDFDKGIVTLEGLDMPPTNTPRLVWGRSASKA